MDCRFCKKQLNKCTTFISNLRHKNWICKECAKIAYEGKKFTCKTCGQEFISKKDCKSRNVGYCSTKCRQETMRGVANPRWKGGITPENKKIRASIEYRLWREAVFARDNWTCEDCGERGGELHSHHIKSFSEYPDLRFAIDNGLTLCKNCHKKTDSYLKVSS